METEKKVKDQIINARKDLNKLEQHSTVYLEKVIRGELEVTQDKVEDLREIITKSNENLGYEVKEIKEMLMLGENIKKLRKERNLTQKQLAELIKISTSYLQQLELGQKENPSINVLDKLAEVLNVQVDYLLDRFEYKDLKVSMLKEFSNKELIKEFRRRGKTVSKKEAR
ncbi:helix-turn-helix domain-containing protein [Clostridium frigidicarnis]|nr:helix-turn-helix transcriptional regulator [Clostridium frigidicarnis]